MRLSIITYHRICNVDDNFDYHRGVVSASPANFEAQLRYLKHNRTIITTNDLLYIMKHNLKLPPKATVVTFDDGYRDNYSTALPILLRQGVTAIFFITTGFVDQKLRPWSDDLAVIFNRTKCTELMIDGVGWVSLQSKAECLEAINRVNVYIKHYKSAEATTFIQNLSKLAKVSLKAEKRLFMNWDEVLKLQKAGMILAPHTETHLNLATATLAQSRSEIERSQARLTEMTGKTSAVFAYPYGEQVARAADLQEILRNSGVELAFTTEFGPNRLSPTTNYLALRRFNVHHSLSMIKFKIMLTGNAYAAYNMRHMLLQKRLKTKRSTQSILTSPHNKS